MTEEQILNAIANACEDSTLRFQIIIQDGKLHVYINRPTKADLNYQELKSKISAVINHASWLNFAEVWLYCRVLGEIEPDWQSVLEIESSNLQNSAQISSMIGTITDALEATNLIVDKIEQQLEISESFAEDPWFDFEELPTTADDQDREIDSEKLASIDDAVLDLDLQKYCFISNQRLLYAVLEPPEAEIARLINTFAQFASSIKRSQLPVLQMYFERLVIPDLDDFELEVQIWWTKIIKLELKKQRFLAIWLSRYCLNPEATISTINQVFIAQAQANQKYHQKINNSFSSPSSFNSSQQFAQLTASNRHNSHSLGKSGLFSRWRMLLGKLRQIFGVD